MAKIRVVILGTVSLLILWMAAGCGKSTSWETVRIEEGLDFKHRLTDISHTSSLLSISMSSEDNGWAVGSGGLILRFRDGRWRKQVDIDDLGSRHVSRGGTNAQLNAVSVAKDKAWVGGVGIAEPEDLAENTDLLISAALLFRVDGKDLENSDVESLDVINDIEMLHDGQGWACGFRVILTYDGNRWSRVDLPNAGGILSLAMRDANEGWAVGPRLLHYMNGVWSYEPHEMPYGMRALLLEKDGSLLIGGVDELLRLDEGELTTISGFKGRSINSMASGPDGLTVLVGTDDRGSGKIMFLLDDQKLPQEISYPEFYREPSPPMELTDIAFDSSHHGWIVGWGATMIEFMIDAE